MDHIDLDNYGLHVVNFESIFTAAYKQIVKDLILYDKFTDLNIRNQDTKKIYYYYIVKTLCDYVSNVNTSNRVVVFFSDKDIKCDFKQCTNKRTRKGTTKDSRSEFILFMNRFFKQIKNILPIKVYTSNVKFNTFVQYYNTNKGKYTEIVNILRTSKASPTNMEKFKKFTQKFGLTYLTKHYVNNMRIKCMMYK